MAATATVSQGRHVKLSEGYVYVYDVSTYSYYNHNPNPNYHPNYLHSLHKRSPITPLKPTNPFIKAATFGLLTPITLPVNAGICAATIFAPLPFPVIPCSNKLFGLVI